MSIAFLCKCKFHVGENEKNGAEFMKGISLRVRVLTMKLYTRKELRYDSLERIKSFKRILRKREGASHRERKGH